MINEIQKKRMTTRPKGKPNKLASKKGELGSKIRRLLAKNWTYVEQKESYIKAVCKKSCNNETCKIKNELFDGVVLKLNTRNSVKSLNVQTRILRKIIEKRQAQPIHQQIGRTKNLFASYLLRESTSKSMNNIKIQCITNAIKTYCYSISDTIY